LGASVKVVSGLFGRHGRAGDLFQRGEWLGLGYSAADFRAVVRSGLHGLLQTPANADVWKPILVMRRAFSSLRALPRLVALYRALSRYFTRLSGAFFI
jgi:hypothetical protein